MNSLLDRDSVEAGSDVGGLSILSHGAKSSQATSPLARMQSIVMSMSLSVCPLTLIDLLCMLPVTVAQCCDTLCTSGFVDDVIFSRHVPTVCRVYSSICKW